MAAPLIGTGRHWFLRNLWRLTKPYWTSEEKWIAWGLLIVVVGLSLFSVYLSVVYNYWNRDFFNAIQQKDEPKFWHQLILFCPLVTAFIVSGVAQYYLQNWLMIRWRHWLTRRYQANWLADRVYYRIELANRATDNPDQRIQEDLKNFTESTLSLGLDALSEAVTVVSFFGILWALSGAFSFSLGAHSFSIPGYMVWVAFLYTGIGSWLTHLVGRRLSGLYFQQQRFEADFRFSLVRVRENAEGVALYRGEADEGARLNERFNRVIGNWFDIMRLRKWLITFTVFYGQLAGIFPIIVAAPGYFAGTITLGIMTQTIDAFGQVQGSLSWFVQAYRSLAEWKASVDRLISFDQAISEAEASGVAGVGIDVTSAETANLDIENVDLRLPDGRSLVPGINAEIAPGERVLVSGPSGSGKSTLIRAIAGIWPYGAGRIALPRLQRLLFLPQRPYVPIGSLRNAVTFPARPGSFSDAEIVEALKACKLAEQAGRLDEEDHWDRRLSPGEQQRLAIARALLQRPDWLFLDEATASLDPEMESDLYKLLLERLPKTTMVSIAHRTTLNAFHSRRLRFATTEKGTELTSEPVA
jgi:vitamin B12/bleomycin/antimicrobial peptide transport system ATP-binding/permease protein